MDFGIEASTLITLLLIATRIMAWAAVAPPVATAGMPQSIKAILSVALALALVGIYSPQAPELALGPVVGSLILQVVIGSGLGFLTRLLFTAVEMAGGFFDLFGGFAMSQAYDPITTTMTTIIGKFYAILCTTLIFATNAHLIIFGGFMRSFAAVPLTGAFAMDRLGRTVAHATTEMFLAALQIAGPLILVLFIADVGLGVLNRIAPQLNAFTMSFPVKIGLTLILTGVGMMTLPAVVVGIADRANSLISGVIG